MTKSRQLAVVFLLGLTAVNALAGDASGGHGSALTERMMLLAVQLGLILFAAKIGNMLFNRWKLPGVLGELISGVVIGPFALGRIGFPGFAHGLFPLASEGGAVSPELYAFGAVAAIILLFDVGLETDLKLLLRYTFAGTIVGVGGVVFSFITGAWVTSALSMAIIGSELSLFHPACLFMGVVSTATSVGITARVLSEKKKLDSPEGVTILSAAVVDDVIGIIMLAVVLGIVASTAGGGDVDWGAVGLIGIKALAVWLISSIIGIAASRRISFLLKYFRDPTSIAVMALGLALILAGLFEQAGLAMIIGAYVMGLSLSQTDISHLIREKLHPIYTFLVPVFFCITGMLINVHALFSLPVLLFGCVFTLVAFAAKIIGCGLPALAANFNLYGAARIGVGMVPRGEVGLIVAGIGAGVALMPDGGPLPDALFASVVMMVMISTIAAPPLLAKLVQSNRRGTRREAAAASDYETLEFELPSTAMAAFFSDKLRAEFEGEGFFWHRIDRERHLYQLRKDEVIIDFRREGAILAFSVHATDMVLVRGVMLEATAAFEDALRGLHRPFDARSIGQGLLGGSASPPPKFNLGQVLSEKHIQPELRSRSKEQVIDELLQILVDRGELTDVAAARTALWERERKMSTALDQGVAIPHGKTDAVTKLVCAVGICRDGIDCDSLDGQSSRIFVMTLSPKSRPTPHIQFMATIGQLLNDTGRMYLLDKRSASEILAYMTGGSAGAPRPWLLGRQVKVTDTFDLRLWLSPAAMTPHIRGTFSEEIIHELLQLAAATRQIDADIDAIAREVLERERRSSTVMVEGIALPHARTDLVKQLSCVVGLKPEGVDFDGDGVAETRMIFLVLAPNSSQIPYLQFVAALMKRLDEPGRARLLAAGSGEQMHQVLTGSAVGIAPGVGYGHVVI